MIPSEMFATVRCTWYTFLGSLSLPITHVVKEARTSWITIHQMAEAAQQR